MPQSLPDHYNYPNGKYLPDNYNFYSFKDKGYNWKDHWALNLKGQKNPWDVKGREFYDFIKQHKNVIYLHF